MPAVVYASSSSVYGLNTKQPFSETDPVEKPASLYASTKRVRLEATDVWERHQWDPPANVRANCCLA